MSAAQPPTSRLVTFRNAFISGALLLAPLIVTIWAFSAIIDAVGGTFRPLYEHYLPATLQVAAALPSTGLLTARPCTSRPRRDARRPCDCLVEAFKMDVNVVDVSGETPLFYAKEEQRWEVVGLLREHDARRDTDWHHLL